MTNEEKRINEIIKAGKAMGEAQEPMRFKTQHDRQRWHNEQIRLLNAALAPAGDEPYDENMAGDKIALRFQDIHTFEVFRINSIRCIVGDFDTWEEYQDHIGKEFMDELNKLTQGLDLN